MLHPEAVLCCDVARRQTHLNWPMWGCGQIYLETEIQEPRSETNAKIPKLYIWNEICCENVSLTGVSGRNISYFTVCVCVCACVCVCGMLSYFPHVTLHSTTAEESQTDLKVARWFPYAGLLSLNDFTYSILKKMTTRRSCMHTA